MADRVGYRGDIGEIDEYSVVKELNPKHKLFADYIIKGYTQTDAYFMAGFMKGRDKRDQNNRNKAMSLASTLAKKPAIKDYIFLNKPISANNWGKVDVDSLVEHLKLIASGNITVKGFTKKGEEVYCPPAFKDQIEATKVLIKVSDKREGQNAESDDTKMFLAGKVSELHKELEKTRVVEIESDYEVAQEIDGEKV